MDFIILKRDFFFYENFRKGIYYRSWDYKGYFKQFIMFMVQVYLCLNEEEMVVLVIKDRFYFNIFGLVNILVGNRISNFCWQSFLKCEQVGLVVSSVQYVVSYKIGVINIC